MTHEAEKLVAETPEKIEKLDNSQVEEVIGVAQAPDKHRWSLTARIGSLTNAVSKKPVSHTRVSVNKV